MADEIIEELWKIKESIARECGYDLDALVAYLKSKKLSSGQRVVDLRATRIAEKEHPGSSNKPPCC